MGYLRPNEAVISVGNRKMNNERSQKSAGDPAKMLIMSHDSPGTDYFLGFSVNLW